MLGSCSDDHVYGEVRLTWVVDDVAAAPLRYEHGFAMWIEAPGGTVLFDTGGSSEVLDHNMALLGLDPAALDAVVLSHAHDDHTGGLAGLLPLLRPGTPLYAHSTLFRRRYSASSGVMVDRGIPLPGEALAREYDLRLGTEPAQVVPGIWTSGEIRDRSEPEGRSAHHWVIEGGVRRPDPYEDDLSLVIEVAPGQYFLLCGCCHAGLLNTLKAVTRRWSGCFTGIGGGVHLVGATPEVIATTLTALRAMGALSMLWLGHCSGEPFVAACAQAYGSRSYRGSAGERLVHTAGHYHIQVAAGAKDKD